MFSRSNCMVLLATVVLVIQITLIECNDNLRVAYQWNEIDFEYRNQRDREEAISSRSFIPGNVRVLSMFASFRAIIFYKLIH